MKMNEMKAGQIVSLRTPSYRRETEYAVAVVLGFGRYRTQNWTTAMMVEVARIGISASGEMTYTPDTVMPQEVAEVFADDCESARQRVLDQRAADRAHSEAVIAAQKAHRARLDRVVAELRYLLPPGATVYADGGSITMSAEAAAALAGIKL